MNETLTKHSGDAEALPVLTLTRKQAAQHLNISESMLDLLTKSGAIAVCKIGRRRLYRPQALADYVERTEGKTRAA